MSLIWFMLPLLAGVALYLVVEAIVVALKNRRPR